MVGRVGKNEVGVLGKSRPDFLIVNPKFTADMLRLEFRQPVDLSLMRRNYLLKVARNRGDDVSIWCGPLNDDKLELYTWSDDRSDLERIMFNKQYAGKLLIIRFPEEILCRGLFVEIHILRRNLLFGRIMKL